jgi:hypothetical protein
LPSLAARRLIFGGKFLKASIADLITLLFSSLQNSEGGGDSDSGDSFAAVAHAPFFSFSIFLGFPNGWSLAFVCKRNQFLIE